MTIMNNVNKRSDNASSEKNSWVICKSKSHPGLNYFFNCLTRESTWHLSEPEREKAQYLSNIMPRTELEKCYEPNNPPDQNTVQRSRIYNKQIINNQFPEMFMSGIPSSSMFNPNIWNQCHGPNTALMPGQPYFIVPGALVPGITPYITQHPVNYGTQNIEFPQMPHRPDNMINRGLNNVGEGGYQNRVQSESFTDLREKLIKKRRKSLSSISWEADDSNDPQPDYDDRTEQHRSLNGLLQETGPKLDLSKVKQLNPSNTQSGQWIIVVDINILVKEFKFLNRLTDPEQNCYLLVPDHVMCELQARAYTGRDHNVKLVHRFISEQIKSEIVYRGNDVSFRAQDDYAKTFITCADWAHNNVILLSNDNKFMKYHNNKYGIYILSIIEIKYILECGPPNQEINLSVKKPISLQEIKITVPNDVKNKTKTTEPSSLSTIPNSKPKTFQPPVVIRQNTKDSFKASTSDANVVCENLQKDESILKPTETPAYNNAVNNSSVTKTRHIKLNRPSNSTSNHEISTPIKPFRRWRKQREPPRVPEDLPKQTIKNQELGLNQTKVDEVPSLADIPISKECSEKESPKITTPKTPNSDRSSISSHSKNKSTTQTEVALEVKKIEENSNRETKEKKNYLRSAVMFQAEGENMNEVLRTGRDEWVTRFVQIMEEVLKQKLQDNSALHLHEAVRSIIQKYSIHFSVVDAANRLSFILSQIRDDTGNIKADIEPSEYMEMYSYGVYLVETLKDINNNCEDLAIADASLKKLLADIRECNLESQNDTFNEGCHDAETNVPEAAIDEEMAQQTNINGAIEAVHEDLTESNTCHSRHSRENDRVHCENVVTVQKNTPVMMTEENSFFSSLQLQKTFQNSSYTPLHNFQDSVDKDLNADNVSVSLEAPTYSPLSPVHATKENDTVDDCADNNKTPTYNVVVQPVIARNFVNIPLFEEKLKKKNYNILHLEENSKKVKSNMPPFAKKLKKKNFVIPTFEEKYKSSNLVDQRHMSDGTCLNDIYENTNIEGEQYVDCDRDVNETCLEEIIVNSNINTIPCETATCNDDKFMRFIREFVGEIRATFQNVIVLCFNIARDDLDGHSSVDRAEKARILLKNISESLESIMHPEIKAPGYSLIDQLKNVNLENYIPSESLHSQYLDIITQCKDQADCLLDTIAHILEEKEKHKINS